MIGVGALSLPKAFSQAGLVLGALLLFILAFVSYVTATYMVEAMANANAYMKYQFRLKRSKLALPGSPSIQRNLAVKVNEIFYITVTLLINPCSLVPKLPSLFNMCMINVSAYSTEKLGMGPGNKATYQARKRKRGLLSLMLI